MAVPWFLGVGKNHLLIMVNWDLDHNTRVCSLMQSTMCAQLQLNEALIDGKSWNYGQFMLSMAFSKVRKRAATLII